MENNKIDKIKIIGYVSTLAGTNPYCGQADGSLNIALFGYDIQGIYFDSTNDQLLISDSSNNRFKVLDFNCRIFLLFYFFSFLKFKN